MKIDRVILDLDDVLNCFTLEALAHVGCDIEPGDFDSFKPEWGFGIIQAANDLHVQNESFTLSTFWSKFDRQFWAELPKSKEFEAIF